MFVSEWIVNGGCMNILQYYVLVFLSLLPYSRYRYVCIHYTYFIIYGLDDWHRFGDKTNHLLVNTLSLCGGLYYSHILKTLWLESELCWVDDIEFSPLPRLHLHLVSVSICSVYSPYVCVYRCIYFLYMLVSLCVCLVSFSANIDEIYHILWSVAITLRFWESKSQIARAGRDRGLMCMCVCVTKYWLDDKVSFVVWYRYINLNSFDFHRGSTCGECGWMGEMREG